MNEGRKNRCWLLLLVVVVGCSDSVQLCFTTMHPGYKEPLHYLSKTSLSWKDQKKKSLRKD
jgi:hypothetical protein